MLDRLFNRQLAVRLSLGQPEQDNTRRAVREICDLIGSDPDDIYSQFLTGPELGQRFSEATTPTQVIYLAQTLGAEFK